MGTDKALVAIDGEAMAQRVVSALWASGAEDVVCVGGDRPALRRLGLVSIEDEWPGEGPLGGLATALGWSVEAAVVVVGCDQPWLDAEAVGALFAARRASTPEPVTVFRVDGVLQPLPGVYEVSLRDALLTALTDGARALGTVLRMAEPCAVEAPDARALRDVDRPEDLPPA